MTDKYKQILLTDAVLDCWWMDTKYECVVKANIEYNRTVNRHLSITIRQVTFANSGVYACQVYGYNTSLYQKCYLQIKTGALLIIFKESDCFIWTGGSLILTFDILLCVTGIQCWVRFCSRSLLIYFTHDYILPVDANEFCHAKFFFRFQKVLCGCLKKGKEVKRERGEGWSPASNTKHAYLPCKERWSCQDLYMLVQVGETSFSV